jgi:L-ascorbate metabolism protein UlaG (beta-lactamase superfamily)
MWNRLIFAVAGFATPGCLMATSANTASSYENHFDGQRFYNVPDRDHAGIGDGLKWYVNRDPGPWDEPQQDVEFGEPPPRNVVGGEARVTYVNHATVLIQINGVNILTDPVYAERVGPVSWLAIRRVRPPGIRFDDLPKIDAVLVSHNHYDHLCLETLKRLTDRDRPAICTGLRVGALLEDVEIGPVKELDWWESEMLDRGVEITFVPAQHFSNRGAFDRFETLWGGFVVASEEHRIYFAGDTGEGPHFQEIAERVGPPDLALLPIGAFRPRHIMGPIHLSPGDAVAAHTQLGARHSVGIHFGTFPLADDGQREPLELLDDALTAAGLSRDDFWVLGFGEGRDVPKREVVSWP